MTEPDDEREPHEAKADELERELDEMDERRDKLGEEIGDAGDEWERQKRDSRVPGATSDEDDDSDDDAPDDADELDFGRSLAESDEG